MKKSAITLALAFIGFSAMAQTEKPVMEKGTGIISVDVPLSFSTTHYKDNFGKYNYQSFEIKPYLSGGYFLCNNFMLGAFIGSTTSLARQYDNVSGLYKFTSPTFIHTGITMRYYHMFSPKIGIYGQLMAGSLIQANKYINDDASNGSLGFNLNWAPRLVITPVKQVGINLGLGDLNYSYTAGRSNGTKVSDNHNFKVNPSLNLGVSYFIGR